MSIKAELRAELVDAMKAGDRQRRDVIRSVEAEIQRQRTAPGFSGSGDDDDFYRKNIGSYVKKMRKAAAEYGAMGDRGAQMARKLSFEVDYLSRWLPSHLDADGTRALVRRAIAALGASGDPTARGRVIGHIMRGHRQEVDGSLVARLAAEELSS